MPSASGTAGVGVLGATGAVGRRVVDALAGQGVRLRLGARRPAAVEVPAGADATVVAVDTGQAARLRQFCQGCDVVVNCAGPSHRWSAPVAEAALRAGAGYVDAGGDDPLRHRLAHATAPAVLGAGLSPGLTGVLPRWLAGHAGGRADTLRLWAGGLERFTPAAADDMLRSLDGSYGEPLAAWRDGAAVARAATPQPDVGLSPFPGRVTAYPFLTAENRRVAAALGVRHGDFWNVFPGRRTFAVLSGLRGGPDSGSEGAAVRLARAADVDLAGQRPYQLVVAEIDDDRPLTVTVRADDGYRVTAAVAAAATTAVLAGTVGDGAAWADEVLDPATVVAAVAAVCTVFELTDGPREQTVEEVVL